jgi:hypothetical protein
MPSTSRLASTAKPTVSPWVRFHNGTFGCSWLPYNNAGRAYKIKRLQCSLLPSANALALETSESRDSVLAAPALWRFGPTDVRFRVIHILTLSLTE